MTDQQQAEADGDASTPVETGYLWLAERTKAAVARLAAIALSATSPLNADDQYFHPIYRNFRQNVEQCLYSALDHLRLVAWSLQNRESPHPFAQATLIRTAITGASIALWMISGGTPEGRRERAMEFCFNDLKSERTRIDTLATDPKNLQEWAPYQASVDAHRADIETRLDWIVQQATTLLAPPIPFSRTTYTRTITNESDIVKIAGALAPQVGTGGWDPGIVLVQTWQLLSGYAHARPWAALHGGTLTVANATPDPTTGTVQMSAKGDPERLLDVAFRALVVAETAIELLERLSK